MSNIIEARNIAREHYYDLVALERRLRPNMTPEERTAIFCAMEIAWAQFVATWPKR